jgi:putative flavoprotein involved in K+ transport
MDGNTERIQTVVIGGGQAGLAVGYHLAQANRPFVILDAHERVGDAWRKRWDSLRVFSPARLDGLPGRPFPISGWYFPTKDEMADYFEDYAATFALPVRTGVRVTRVSKSGQGFVVESDHGRFEAEHVVIASGHEHTPRTPDFARDLDPKIRQLHSSEYRRPSQLAGPTASPCTGRSITFSISHGGALAHRLARDDHRLTDRSEDPAEDAARHRAGRARDREGTCRRWRTACGANDRGARRGTAPR